MMIHVSSTKGDYIFAEWNDEDWKQYNKQVHELRMQGYREIGREADFLNHYQHYRKKGKKKIITVTMMCM